MIWAARARRSCPGSAKLFHNAAAVRAPSAVLTRAATLATTALSVGLLARMYARTSTGNMAFNTAGRPIAAQTSLVSALWRSEAAGVDEDKARDPLRTLQRQPAGRVAADRIANDDDVVQIQQVREFHQHVTELHRAQRGCGRGRLAMARPVKSQHAAACRRQRAVYRREVGAVVQGGVKQHDRRA